MIEKIVNEELGAELLYEKMPYKIKGSIVVCAGGAYVWLSPREQWPVAQAYARAGYQAYVLNYTVGEENAPLGTKPMRQLAWAVKTARELSGEKDHFTGICGFSAGGHLCATLGVHWNDSEIFSKEEQALVRPDALILGYAASDVFRFEGSEFSDNLAAGDRRLLEYLNPIQHVTPAMPPTYLWHTVTDDMVNSTMSIDLAKLLVENNVFTEFHLFPDGLHGLSIATPDVDDPPKGRFSDEHTAEWLKLSSQWLEKVRCRKNGSCS